MGQTCGVCVARRDKIRDESNGVPGVSKLEYGNKMDPHRNGLSLDLRPSALSPGSPLSPLSPHTHRRYYLKPVDPAAAPSTESAYNATVLSRTGVATDSKTWELNFLTDVAYDPGDYILIRPKNDADDVAHLCRLLGLADDELDRPFTMAVSNQDENGVPLSEEVLGSRFRIAMPTTLRQAFSEELDLSCPPSFKLLRSLAAGYDLPENLRYYAEHRSVYNKWIKAAKPNLLTILIDVTLRGQQVPLELLLRAAPLIQPRCYLAASAAVGRVAVCFDEQHITNSSASIEFGLCTRYFTALRPGDKLSITVVRGSFQPPADEKSPLVFIACHLGIAPFKAIIDRFREQDRKNPVYVLWEFHHFERAPYFHEFSAWIADRSVRETLFVTALERNSPDGIALCNSIVNDEDWKERLQALLTKSETEVFVCGTEPFCANVQNVLPSILGAKDAEVVEKRMRVEIINPHVTHACLVEMTDEELSSPMVSPVRSENIDEDEVSMGSTIGTNPANVLCVFESRGVQCPDADSVDKLRVVEEQSDHAQAKSKIDGRVTMPTILVNGEHKHIEGAIGQTVLPAMTPAVPAAIAQQSRNVGVLKHDDASPVLFTYKERPDLLAFQRDQQSVESPILIDAPNDGHIQPYYLLKSNADFGLVRSEKPPTPKKRSQMYKGEEQIDNATKREVSIDEAILASSATRNGSVPPAPVGVLYYEKESSLTDLEKQSPSTVIVAADVHAASPEPKVTNGSPKRTAFVAPIMEIVYVDADGTERRAVSPGASPRGRSNSFDFPARVGSSSKQKARSVHGDDDETRILESIIVKNRATTERRNEEAAHVRTVGQEEHVLEKERASRREVILELESHLDRKRRELDNLAEQKQREQEHVPDQERFLEQEHVPGRNLEELDQQKQREQERVLQQERLLDEKRLQQARLLESERVLEEKRIERERLERELLLEHERLQEERRRKEQEAVLEQERALDEKRREEQERSAEEERRREQERLAEAEHRRREEERVLDEKRLEEERLLEQERRRDEERILEQKRLEKEQERLLEQARRQEEERVLELARLEREQAEKERAIEQKRLEEQQRVLERERSLEEERRWQKHQNEQHLLEQHRLEEEHVPRREHELEAERVVGVLPVDKKSAAMVKRSSSTQSESGGDQYERDVEESFAWIAEEELLSAGPRHVYVVPDNTRQTVRTELYVDTTTRPEVVAPMCAVSQEDYDVGPVSVSFRVYLSPELNRRYLGEQMSPYMSNVASVHVSPRGGARGEGDMVI